MNRQESWLVRTLFIVSLVLMSYRPTSAQGLVAAKAYSAGTAAQGIALGDFNGDGLTDVAVTDYANAKVYVMLNSLGTFNQKTVVTQFEIFFL